ncbi:TetR/AcrR family transcriptional regulator [Shouchella clausii]|uniref:TetR family transcriptional regulator n=1 Tax=Shouchella clausii (strain KSM-K16) TaxID=66692 RepID=Q5WD39_SHOC1|nr:TetR/AcrR family transcriptional regulator [Shouchella clausii]KKI87374.1 hypothetical protein WZ76_05805 [Shouchella clausii]MCM3313076.1 TetR/AcrR family transcriptional regulator [Psychrobacillus sp. MER TA 17]BAD65721.1 TetR family transcriptional regulator [Shouchella clausii KSM-K16]
MNNDDNSPSITEAFQLFLDSLNESKKKTAKQEQIIQAAAKLFAEKGYEASSTADIAKQAGVAEVTLFRNFKSKSNLLYHILAPVFIELGSKKYVETIQEIFRAPEPNNAKETLTMAFQDRLEQLAQNQSIIKVLFREAYSQDEIKKAIVTNITSPAMESTKSFIKQKQEQGEFKDMDESVIANLFFYIIFGYIFYHQVLGEGLQPEHGDEPEKMIDIILEGISTKK